MDSQKLLITLLFVDLTLDYMQKGVSLLFWIFCYINLSNKLLQLFYFVLGCSFLSLFYS